MDQLTAKLSLALAPNIGPVKFKQILAQDSNCSWWNRTDRINQMPLPEASKAALKKPNLNEIEKILIWASGPNHHLICVDADNYPKQLKQIYDPPPFIYVKGSIQNLHEPQIGIVGCRDMSAYGQIQALRFSKELANLGITITSGLAKGIDAIAHQGALQAKGNTIAVLGTGLNTVYPENHTRLAEEILKQNGTLVSEYTPNTGIRREHFPERNRIISGLSLGILVIEAAQKSGSLITAQQALQQNRPVFALPGSIDNPKSKGCHQLLREGAILTEEIQDLLQELHPRLNHWLKAASVNSEMHEKKYKDKNELDLLENLSFNIPASYDELLILTEKQGATLQTELLTLELARKIQKVPGGYLKTKIIGTG